MGRTRIEWTEATWNPVTGCTKVSPGCANCYAERMAKRLRGMGMKRYARGFDVAVHPDALGLPREWRQSRMVFVNSMGDLFHELVPFTFIRDVFEVMASVPHHTFQILTKRSGRLSEVCADLPWPGNVWAGTTVETAAQLPRLDDLRRVPAAVRFVSFEPLLGSLGKIDLSGINWVIVGGESGPRARPMAREWAIEIRDQCMLRGVPFFFKQWGGRRKRDAGRLLDGRFWDEMPAFAPGPRQGGARP